MEKIKVGEKYGRLTILENHHPKNEVLCLCECGNTKIARADNVFYGGTRSCGCLFNEGNNKKHGDKGKRLYIIWKGMRCRCYTKSSSTYNNYGGRGITICEEWSNYENFKQWALNNGYTDNLSIDRIDVNGNYEPSNCRWVSMKKQSNNKRNNRYLEYKGQVKTMQELAEENGIKPATIWARLNRGWDVEKALTT